MIDKNLIKLAVDARKGTVEKYSVSQANETIRQALIEANGGSTVLNYRAIRDGKCGEVFTLLEELIHATVNEGILNVPYIDALVDVKDVDLGDKNQWTIKDRTLFVVADAAEGTQGIRRQRIMGERTVSIPTTFKVVRIYEELNRILSGHVDFNHLVDVVSESFRQHLLNDVYTLWENVTAAQLGGAAYFPIAGTYDEDALMDVVGHVEAAAGGKPATIICTKKAARLLTSTVMSEEAKGDLYNLGYYGKFFGVPVVAIPQSHKPGTTDFALNDKMFTIIATDEKPIKLIHEGDPLIIPGDPLSNADLTQELNYAIAA